MRLKTASLFRRKNLPWLAILCMSLVYLATDFSHHNWTRTKPEARGVIRHDVKMYYAYLTAGIIEKDLKLEFISEPGFKNNYRFWNTKAENGNRIIITSMGLSFMYAPFFLMAHLLANIFGLPADGYGSIYQFFLVFGGLFYAIWGFIILRKILLQFFDPLITAITLILIGIGTNLYYYSTYEAAMAHVYNFFLIAVFIWQVIRWYRKPDWKSALIIGGLLGLISLIRPTNILVFFVLLLWDVKSYKEFGNRIIFYLQKYYLVLFMLVAFIAVWTPQMLYWKIITGKFLYFSYGVAGASFYFGNPQIIGSLFSYIKGWYVYTPVMLFATLGILLLRKRMPLAFLPVFVLLVTMIYVQSSWWSWWFGGGFGLRAYIDIYAVMAIPLAVLVERSLNFRLKWVKIASASLMIFLIFFSWLQTYQYKKGMIHYCGMTKESYWLNFLRFSQGHGYWDALKLPDHQLARLGIYYYYDTGEKDTLGNIEKEKALEMITDELKSDNKVYRQVCRYAERNDVSIDSALEEVAERIYTRKTSKKE